MKNQKLRNDFVAKTFELDCSDEPFHGYAFLNDYWNGWGCPYFEFETMQNLAKVYSPDGYDAYYWSEKDEFLFFDREAKANGETEGYVKRIGSTVINGMKLYKAHELCWCFYETVGRCEPMPIPIEQWDDAKVQTVGNLLEAYTLTAHEWHKAFNANSPSQYALDDVCHILRERLERDWGLTVEEINKRSEAIADELGLA